MSSASLRASLDKLIDQYGWEQVCDTWNEIVKEGRPKPLSSASRPATPSSSNNGPRRTPSYLRMTHLLGNPPSTALPSLPDPLDNRISSHSASSLDVSKLTPPMSEKRFDFGKTGDEGDDLIASLEFLRAAPSAPPPPPPGPTPPTPAAQTPKHKPADYASFMDRPMPKRPPRPESGILSAADLIAAGWQAAPAVRVRRRRRDPPPLAEPEPPQLTAIAAQPALPASPSPPPRPPPPPPETHKVAQTLPGSPPKLPPPSPIDPLPAVPSRSSSRAHLKSPGPGTNIAHTPTTLPYTFADDEPEDAPSTARVRADVQQWQWEETNDSN
ncbi:hypothetical protein A1Q1_01500 [Trichosporon asahii var. asahii CBS 2479]|uniref:Uncharacterized protein n=1 Tax=Trichosporon asahii var. asahii (strain ATCC 90039 / CBS 2479 / JCM 2466 / KCTC 7840 / NBRC 103889/ NCYC 2677 / UAMH 7654) TaxID=1186058 RepID=J4UDX9_TRIAS|nr:hypothetical protein A1Q1_01500 [Trichosporon asahii var. asahii CBS 2479]EJT49405.1 hypothetical protein A1Q1_01500 [Trichosporon asahii var. asahii CBS 2479]